MAIFKSYLTSLEPDMSQTIYSQSIGGYYSNSLLYIETTLASTVGLYDTSIPLETPSSGSWTQWQGVEYINIGNEVIQVFPIVNGNITVVQRGYNGIINMHKDGDEVRAFSQQLFNSAFNDDYKQYRCIAIKNESLLLENPSGGSVAYNFSVNLKQNSRNNDSLIKISLEQPASQYISSTSTSWTTMQIVDTSLIGVYSDNYFKEAYLKILSGGNASGQGKIINSFDSTTGTFTFYSSFSSLYNYDGNVDYEILPAPAQRIKTGAISPMVGNSNVLSFVETSILSPLRFIMTDVSGTEISDLYPNDVVYIWFERTVEKGAENFNNNDIVLNVNYSVNG